MRILYHHRTVGDGAEGIHIREMVSAFRDLGHEVRVVALVGEETSRAAPRRNRWAAISRLMPKGIYELAELGYNFVGRRAVDRAIREFQPHFVYDRYNSYTTCAVAAARRTGLPAVLEVNTPVAWERVAYENRRLAFPRLAERYERTACNLADHIFVVSTPLKEFLVSHRRVPEEKITVLPNGANPATFDPHCSGEAVRKQYGIGGRTVIGFVGILRPWHGIEMLLTAFSTLLQRGQNIHLLLLGDGPSQPSLTEMARDLRLSDHVTFAGRVGHSEVSQHIAAMDIAVSPHATFYASPMKILEYMAIGRPTVAPRMPNILDILEDGKDCRLFEPESPESLAEALLALVGDLPLAKKMGALAREKVENRYNWRWNAQRVLKQIEVMASHA